MSISEAIGRDDNENPHGKSNPAASAADRNVQGGAQTAGRKNRQQAKGIRRGLTQAQIDQMKKEVSMEATKKAFIMMMGFPLLTLRDKFGFGKERLNQFMDKMLDLYEAYEMDYVDLDDLNDTIMKETGVTLIKKREGKY